MQKTFPALCHSLLGGAQRNDVVAHPAANAAPVQLLLKPPESSDGMVSSQVIKNTSGLSAMLGSTVGSAPDSELGSPGSEPCLRQNLPNLQIFHHLSPQELGLDLLLCA